MKASQQPLVTIIILLSGIIISCSLTNGITNLGGATKIYGAVIPEPKDVGISGTIKLINESDREKRKDKNTTIVAIKETKISTSQLNFDFTDVNPGQYYLDVSIVLNPCFLGAPGQVFNGMIISFMDNWSPVGISLTNGSSIITGATELIEFNGSSVEVNLKLPRCY